jgi:glycosyltransferase involved in cell wall biosynthesis
VTVCSPEDAALVHHRLVQCIPNGSAPPEEHYVPSNGARLLFIGPFRYAPNARGIRCFLQLAWPALRARVPHLELVVLGGDEALATTRADPLFSQAGVRILGHRDDVARHIVECTLTVNPLANIRGSAVKVLESLAAGRACVSTREGARGYRDAGLAGLVLVDDVAGMADAVVHLLTDPAERHRRERPDARALAPFRWEACAGAQARLYERLVHERAAASAA